MALASLVLACGSAPRPGEVNGHFVAHTGMQPGRGFVDSVTVFLGDGSRFLTAVDENGDATFDDSRLVGAQDVTAVVVQRFGAVDVTTVENVQRGEMWFPPPWWAVVSNEPTRHVTIGGTVRRISGSGVTFAAVHGSVQGGLITKGVYSLEVDAPPGDVGVLAVEYFEGTQTPRRMGMTRVDAGILGGIVLSGQDIDLDRTPEVHVELSVSGGEAFGAPVTGARGWLIDEEGRTYASIGAGLDGGLDTFSLAPPFDAFHVELSSGVFQTCPAPEGAPPCRARTRNTNERLRFSALPSSVQLSLMPPLELTSPSLDGAWVGAGLEVKWKPEPAAQWVRARIAPHGSGGLWTVWAPPADGKLRFIPLPSKVVTRFGRLSGSQDVTVSHGAVEDGVSYEDLFGPRPGVERHERLRESSNAGELFFFP